MTSDRAESRRRTFIGLLWVSPWLVVVFAALTIRAAVLPAYRLSPKVVGLGETVASVVVSVTALLVT